MFAYEKFEVFDEIASSIPDEVTLTYSPLIREGFLFCLKSIGKSEPVIFKGEMSLSGVSSNGYPEKRPIKKVGFFSDQDFLRNVLDGFVSEGVEIERLQLLSPRMKRVLSNKQKEEIGYFDSKLKESFGVSIREELQERFYVLNGMVAECYKLLKDSGVDALVFRVYYGLYYFPIIFACKMLGITVIDVQHGINGFKHPAYSGFKKSETDSPLLPDVFWTWSSMATRMLLRDSEVSSGSLIVEGGNPVFSRNVGLKEEKNVLYTHQPQSKGIPVPYDEIVKVYEGSRKKVVVRPHPLHFDEAVEVRDELKKKGVKAVIEDSRKISINESLRKSSVHVTYSSTCALDALNYGIPTVYCSDYIGDVESEFSTGLLFRMSEVGEKSLRRVPEKAINYSLGSKERIRSAVAKTLSSVAGNEQGVMHV